MSTLTLREIPEDLRVWLKRQAETHHRSVNKEIIVLLENARQPPRPRGITKAAGLPPRSSGITKAAGQPPSRPGKPSVEDILAMGRECAALPVRNATVLEDRE